jgi:uncharacterized protein YcbK (DUF882 family)
MINWDMFTNFSEDEFCCRCGCGKANMNHEFLVKLQVIRSNIGLPMTITSGYRCEEHDKNIGGAGPHTTGRAVDISIMGQSAYLLLRYAIDTMTGIGVSQKGDTRFLHFDDLDEGYPRPMIWSY